MVVGEGIAVDEDSGTGEAGGAITTVTEAPTTSRAPALGDDSLTFPGWDPVPTPVVITTVNPAD